MKRNNDTLEYIEIALDHMRQSLEKIEENTSPDKQSEIKCAARDIAENVKRLESHKLSFDESFKKQGIIRIVKDGKTHSYIILKDNMWCWTVRNVADFTMNLSFLEEGIFAELDYESSLKWVPLEENKGE